MKKNYFLTLVATLFVAATASAADNLVGIYKLTDLTAEQTEALGSLSPDAAIRIMPGDGEADYYVSGIAGYGCQFAATYDEAAGTLKAVDNSPYGEAFGIMLLSLSDIGAIYVDGTSIDFKVQTNGTLELGSEIIVVDMYTSEIYGTYIPGISLVKDTTPAIPVSEVVGIYTFTGIGIDYSIYDIENVKYSMSIEQVDGNALTINGFMGVDGISATYIPEAGMIAINAQQIGEIEVMQNNGNILFTVSTGELELISPAVAAGIDGMPVASVIEGKAVKGDADAIENVTIAPSTSISASNGTLYINSAEPVAVQVYNAAGVKVYSNDATSGAVALPKGIYLVKVAGNAKAVSVAL